MASAVSPNPDAPTRTSLLRRLHDALLVGFAALFAAGAAATLVAGAPAPAPLALAAGACFLAGMAGMYFQLRRELPEHPLARAVYLGKRNPDVWRLVQFHFAWRGLDAWSALVVVALLLLAAAIALGTLYAESGGSGAW